VEYLRQMLGTILYDHSLSLVLTTFQKQMSQTRLYASRASLPDCSFRLIPLTSDFLPRALHAARNSYFRVDVLGEKCFLKVANPRHGIIMIFPFCITKSLDAHIYWRTQKLNRVFVHGGGFSWSMGLPTLAGLFKALMESPERHGES
jgi:hypothetical protein